MSGPGIGYRFLLRIDREEIGVFTKVEGLTAKYETLSIKEGGQNGFVHKLPGRVSYENIKLTRPVDAGSGKVAAWFSEYQRVMESGGELQRIEAALSAYNADDEVIATWTLADVFPVSYTGPSFSAGGSEILKESLELAHHGFTFEGGSGGGASSGPGRGATSGFPSGGTSPSSMPSLPSIPSIPSIPSPPSPPAPPPVPSLPSIPGL